MTISPPPPSLQPGDCIGIIAPGGQLRDLSPLEQGVSILQEMGFEIRLPRQLWPGTGYLADTDSNRALEFHRMWADPEISAVFALRGGFGCLRLLNLLDRNQLRQHQKMLIGFSDITILHQALFQATKMVSLHGPMLTTLSSSSRESVERLYACLRGKWKIPVHNSKIEVLRGGDPARGTLLGGNLSSLMSLLATPLEQDWTDAILFLEDVGEPLYRIDRMLTQLAHCGKFNQARGIILGDFSLTRDQDRLERLRFHEQIWMRVLELTEPTGIPVWGDFPVGHGPDNLTLPHGAEAAMDSGQRILSFF
ncbi:MAG: LD-carboxypeptidase [Proteobacteria bacterium]|nr:LD-carboxypeptidase [Pseudomonadota bacterium]MBU1232237.1 LD-carboxypeptidase [Pseudomonadota bacterium]MBU1417076.1 LD-carboxypeptidase [Pseudomonadota bacterium]MBU1453772.1 LD-carboxypeptidase [Pseudomonadota bacterium]